RRGGGRLRLRPPPPDPRRVVLPTASSRDLRGSRNDGACSRGRSGGAISDRSRPTRSVPDDRLRSDHRAVALLRRLVADPLWAGSRVRDHRRSEHDPVPAVAVVLGRGARLYLPVRLAHRWCLFRPRGSVVGPTWSPADPRVARCADRRRDRPPRRPLPRSALPANPTDGGPLPDPNSRPAGDARLG